MAPIRIVAGASARTAIATRTEGERLRRAFEAWVDVLVQAVDQAERDRRQDHHDGQGSFEEPVHPQRLSDSVCDPATHETADRDPTEEPGQDRRDGLGRVPEDQDQLPGPDDLVDEGGRPDSAKMARITGLERRRPSDLSRQ